MNAVRSTSVIESLARRYAAYRATPISPEISPADDMYDPSNPAAAASYMASGRSAMDVIMAALLTAKTSRIERILDLPCGGGRVTRHLRAFFPDAQIWAADLAEAKQEFVIDTFGCYRPEPNNDFRASSPRPYDLIFVGSLLTHFDEMRFRRSLDWFGDALAPGGIAVITLHGRYCDFFQRQRYQMIAPEQWESVAAQYARTGFGYEPYRDESGFHGALSYGISYSRPSFVFGHLEQRDDLRIIGYHERAWNAHQDAVVFWKRPLNQDD
jgi:SAM-dependent methyltransferase